jgi:tRNA U38,U39,U40 pseudouridine synthase TruA
MQEPISWELKQRLIKSAQAERTRYMQAVFAAGFTFCWRRIRRLISITSLLVESNRRIADGQAD